jgi:hypothetical protein
MAAADGQIALGAYLAYILLEFVLARQRLSGAALRA